MGQGVSRDSGSNCPAANIPTSAATKPATTAATAPQHNNDLRVADDMMMGVFLWATLLEPLNVPKLCHERVLPSVFISGHGLNALASHIVLGSETVTRRVNECDVVVVERQQVEIRQFGHLCVAPISLEFRTTKLTTTLIFHDGEAMSPPPPPPRGSRVAYDDAVSVRNAYNSRGRDGAGVRHVLPDFATRQRPDY